MKHDINSPKYNDNRKYDYSFTENEDRNEYSRIVDLISPNSKVIDMGCGNGSLLNLLKEKKNIQEFGIELSESGVEVCRKKELNVVQGRIDEELKITDNAFDYAICNVTIQMVNYPEILLKEMKRISKRQIISFPNFGFYKNRIDFLAKGRMPKPMLFGYSWYSTGHLHQLTIKDFYELIIYVEGIKVINVVLEKSSNPIKNYFLTRYPNLFQVLPIFLLEKV
ncbi:MAG: methyltransferase domain-containing protein [Ignavibacteriales bacterium]|nr:methyltransferase domain-containing protein [Ignavibacteriales bacterium]